MWRLLTMMVAALMLSACGDRFPDYRYKMTIYVDTPEGERAFSSVREVRMTERRTILDSTGVTIDRELEGEAVILDLPSGPVFALLSVPDDGNNLGADYGKKVAEAALLPYVSKATLDRWLHGKDKPGDPIADDAAVYQEMVQVKGPIDLPRTRANPIVTRKEGQPLWPMLVTFGVLSDPRTAREVSPESVGIQRITVEITDDDVTTGVETKVPWWEAYQGRHFDGSSTVSQDLRTTDIRAWLSSGQFSTEFNR